MKQTHLALLQVRDSEEDEEGNLPKHCIVSGATRRELAGSSGVRVSQTKAKEVYFLYKSHLAQLEFT